jgi:proline dehydrogenase
LVSRAWLWISGKEPVERLVRHSRLTRPVVDRFVAGNDAEDAIDAIKALNAKNIGGILDLLGEGVTDAGGADEAARAYLQLVKRIDETKIDTTVSVKPTQLGLAFDKGACIDHLRRICAEAQAVGASIEIDMEQSVYVDDTLDVYRLLAADFTNLRVAMQVCLRRTPVDLEAMTDLKPRVRLVKGAYAEPGSISLQKRKEIDEQYRFLSEWLLEKGTEPAFATHDHRLIDHAMLTAARLGQDTDDFEVQMLYGIRRDLQESLAKQGVRVKIYVPFGQAWYPYLMRRIAERPSNIWFFLRAVAGR